MLQALANFWKELRRRKVIRVAIAYLVVAWLVIEVANVLLPTLLLPEWSLRLVTALVALGFPVAVVLAWAFNLTVAGLQPETATKSSTPTRSLPAAGSTVSRDQRRSILVLPFANLSEDPGHGFFSDGVTEEILDQLSRQPGLRVMSRTTSFSFRDSNQDLQAIAARLGVELVLEGSVRRSGQRLRITTKLVDAANDSHLWSDRYDRELDDIFQVQADIARRIVSALHLEPQPARELLPPTGAIEAWDFYLRGRQYLHMLTEKSLDLALQMFRQAIALDPAFARAHAGIAHTESLVAQWFSHSPEHLESADLASREALRLAPELADAHAARGSALSVNGAYAEAAAAFETALSIEPGNYDTLYLYGRSRFAAGDAQAASELWLRAHAAQPDEYQAICLRVTALQRLERDQRLEETLREARRVIRLRLDLNPDDQRALNLGSGVMIESGRSEEGLAMVERLLALAPTDATSLYSAACSYAHAGHHQRALDLLERRLEVGQIHRDWVAQDPDFDGLRDDPRFIALLQRMAEPPSRS